MPEYDGDFEFIFPDGHNFSFCGSFAEAQAEYNRLWLNGNPVKDVKVHPPQFVVAHGPGMSRRRARKYEHRHP